MPDPDGRLDERDLDDKVIIDRHLSDDLTTSTFTATTRFTGEYETNVAAADTARIRQAAGVMWQFTGDGAEASPGAMKTQVSGAGATRTLQTTFWGPSFIDDLGSLFLVLRSASFDDSTTPPGLVFGYTGDSAQTAEFRMQNGTILRNQDGKIIAEGELEIPAVTSDPASPADGSMWVHTSDNALYLWEGGAKRTIASW